MRPTTILLACALLLPAITVAVADAPEAGHEPVRVVVDLDDVTEARLDEAAAATGSRIVLQDDVLRLAAVLTPDPAALEAHLGAPAVLDARGAATGAVRTPLAVVPDDSYYALQWGPIALNLPQAWAVEAGDASVVVAVVDSGIEPTHPDLAGASIDLGQDYVDGDENPLDENGHGTHVTGTILATRGNGRGVVGMADVTVLAIRVLDANGSGWCSDFAAGIREAADKGADVINLSLYCDSDYWKLEEAVRYAEEQGVLVVASAGNFQDDAPGKCVVYPAKYAQAMAVAALDPTLDNADYSCVGPEVEIAAPGSLILSTVLNGRYGFYSGTSMAAPHVSAVAALLKSRDPGMDGDALRARLTSTARDLGEPGRDPETGSGMVDPVAALTSSPLYVP